MIYHFWVNMIFVIHQLYEWIYIFTCTWMSDWDMDDKWWQPLQKKPNKTLNYSIVRYKSWFDAIVPRHAVAHHRSSGACPCDGERNESSHRDWGNGWLGGQVAMFTFDSEIFQLFFIVQGVRARIFFFRLTWPKSDKTFHRSGRKRQKLNAVIPLISQWGASDHLYKCLGKRGAPKPVKQWLQTVFWDLSAPQKTFPVENTKHVIGPGDSGRHAPNLLQQRLPGRSVLGPVMWQQLSHRRKAHPRKAALET